MKTILIIDDDAMSIEFMKIFLESEGYVVLTATSCSEACQIFDENKPSVIITDIDLPDGNGVDVARHALKEASPFIIAVTGYNEQALKDQGIAISVFGKIIIKPVDLIELKKWIPD